MMKKKLRFNKNCY